MRCIYTRVSALKMLLSSIALMLSACVDKVDPVFSAVELESREQSALPQLTLARRVVPVHTTKTVTAWVGERRVEEVSSSRFGGVGKVAKPKCTVEGLRRALPDATIVPTQAFWERVAAPEETIELSRVFAQPALARLQELDVDVLVAAYHQLIDVESFFSELVMAGGVSHDKREVAAVAVVEIETERLIHVTRAVYSDSDAFGHIFFVVPMGRFTVPSSRPCESTGEQAGTAIRASVTEPDPRIVVVATESDPFTAATSMAEHDETNVAR